MPVLVEVAGGHKEAEVGVGGAIYILPADAIAIRQIARAIKEVADGGKTSGCLHEDVWLELEGGTQLPFEAGNGRASVLGGLLNLAG